jgi:pSer/pThr/pTyr-binding forkhead associated (FHA) protein
VSVVDLNSTNGTLVNGTGVRERVLNDGDEITVGATTLRYEAS